MLSGQCGSTLTAMLNEHVFFLVQILTVAFGEHALALESASIWLDSPAAAVREENDAFTVSTICDFIEPMQYERVEATDYSVFFEVTSRLDSYLYQPTSLWHFSGQCGSTLTAMLNEHVFFLVQILTVAFATATVAPLPVAPQQAPASRPGVAQVVSASPSPRTSGAPRLIQPKQPEILPKLSSGSANMTTPSAAATTRSQSPRAAQHKATPRPAPVPAPQPATTVQRGAAMGLNTGSPLLIGNPAAAQPGMFPAGPAHGTFLLNQYIPGLGHSPILIQGALGQTQSSLGQIKGVQLALRPPHATGLTLGPQTGPRPHGEHPGPPGTPTLVIPQNLGPRPNIFLALPRMMSPPSFAIVPGQPLTLQQLQAMLPTQTILDPAHTGMGVMMETPIVTYHFHVIVEGAAWISLLHYADQVMK
ncbi:hypothetical protein MRX96_043736 [Rhipicephalus microplus]